MTVMMTQAAADRILMILTKYPDKIALRIAVEGGGCSGFSYKYTLETKKNIDDLVIIKDKAVILVDPLSLSFLEGAEVDFVDNLMGQAFQIHNPNAEASCGCGTSFSI